MRKAAFALIALAAVAVAVVTLGPGIRAPTRARHLPGAPANSEAPRSQRVAGTSSRPHAGEEVIVELLEPPAEMYANPPREGPDFEHAGVVRALGRRDVVYDPLLGRAARELANQQAMFDGTVPEDVLDFVLRSSGAVDLAVRQGYSATSRDGMDAVRTQVELALQQAAGVRVRVGIGEVWNLGRPLPRVLGMVVSRREIEIDPTPRRIERGDAWRLAGVLPAGFRDPSALVMFGPQGFVEQLSVEQRGGKFLVEVPPNREGLSFTVALSAVGPYGPTPLLQLPVDVGRAPAASFSTHIAPDESNVRTVAGAEALAFDLLSTDRARHGLHALKRDAQLDAVARAHSEDMRGARFFGHVSPAAGGPSERLARAHIRTAAHGENVASGNVLHDMERALLASLPHRQCVLTDRFAHVGIGVADGQEGGRTVWYLTQLFADPAEGIDESAWVRHLEQTIASLRQDGGLPALVRDQALQGIADRHARRSDAENARGDAVVEDLRRAGVAPRSAIAWVGSASRVDELELPPRLKTEKVARYGIAVYQPPDDPRGTVRVALLLVSEIR